MAGLLRKGVISRCNYAVSSCPINSCRTLGTLRTCDSKLCSKRSTLMASLVVQKSSGNSFRLLSTSSLASKWVTGRDAMKPGLAPTFARVSHRDDPEFYTMVKKYKKNRPDDPDFTYRSPPVRMLRGEELYTDHRVTTFFGTIFFLSIFYRLYWHPHEMMGHMYMPYIDEEFTDEELGIPPDDAPDPEYWGHHGEPQGTY